MSDSAGEQVAVLRYTAKGTQATVRFVDGRVLNVSVKKLASCDSAE